MPISTLTHADALLAPAAARRPNRSEAFILCEFGAVCIAIAQADVVTIEHGAELSPPLPGEQVAGWFGGAGDRWPVYMLDAELKALWSQPAGAFVVFINGSPSPVGVLCESVRIPRANSGLIVQPLPSVMRDPESAIVGTFRIDKTRLAWVLRPSRLAAQLNNSFSLDAQPGPGTQ
jgi:hypothetical protein